MNDKPFVQVRELVKAFPIQGANKSRMARAVNGVNFDIFHGETFGVVGESGCGKTVTGKMLLKLIKPDSGDILFDGTSIVKMSGRRFRRMRRNIQTVFQDPNASLDPRMTIENILAEPVLLHKIMDRPSVKGEVLRLLDAVGLEASIAKAFPYELSSGQKQRVGIARAIATRPQFILCDEPVSALDVSVQSQILNLLMDLKAKMGTTYLFISHSLGVVHHVSDRVAVMYAGRIVEIGTTREVFDEALHPYTQALLAASPVPDPESPKKSVEIAGEVPSSTDLPSGCAFHPRCPYASDLCRTVIPVSRSLSSTHSVCCHHAD